MLSCEVNGETKYIWKFRDFAECMDPSVFRAITQFFGEDEPDGNYIERIRNLEYRVGELEGDYETLESEYDDLEDENERMQGTIDKIEKENEQAQKYIDALRAIVNIAEEAIGNDK